ncbi:cytidine deaminase [Flavobacterium cyanobacteriorum]|uniref:Cytidine deaminase n=1 Tax=Flavobacterium cyanobacteriorum TaxID=2022802 RepID=A0A255ZJB8_9FLAO|nr:cytidine deaminase [Flavobacterium cyanobacteriorum]OYQ41576.1 cytidine deaminase [Flavobacterium cyanobacteriorum]
MEKISITASFTVFSSAEELPENIKNLMRQAVVARANAYAPYSRFRVGVALELDNGVIVQGNNQENAAYPSGLCAERVAVFHAGAVYPGATIVRMAISAASDDKVVDSPIPPCGSCRQAIAEYELKQEHPIEIYFMGQEGNVLKADSLKSLLPLVFDRNFL